jgi:hypothetical protein
MRRPKAQPEYDLAVDHMRFKAVLKEAEELRWRKLNDYGASYRNFGSLGVAVRLGDKMARLTRLIQNPKSSRVKDESLVDTALDLVNYAGMLVMLLREEFKK